MNAAQHISILGLRVYRWVISPAKNFLFGPLGHCRFTPSCSAYAIEAIGRHGVLAGSWLALKRLSRCHPWGGSGEDLVPKVWSPAFRRPKVEMPANVENRNVVPPEGGTPNLVQNCCQRSG